MNYYFKSVLVDRVTGEIIGYEITSDNETVVGVTFDKAKELGVLDIEDLQYLDLPIIEVVSTRGRYALIDYADIYISSNSDIPYEKNEDDSVSIYGYVFQSYRLMSLDNQAAIDRLSVEKEDI